MRSLGLRYMPFVQKRGGRQFPYTHRAYIRGKGFGKIFPAENLDNIEKSDNFAPQFLQNRNN